MFSISFLYVSICFLYEYPKHLFWTKFFIQKYRGCNASGISLWKVQKKHCFLCVSPFFIAVKHTNIFFFRSFDCVVQQRMIFRIMIYDLVICKHIFCGALLVYNHIVSTKDTTHGIFRRYFYINILVQYICRLGAGNISMNLKHILYLYLYLQHPWRQTAHLFAGLLYIIHCII